MNDTFRFIVKGGGMITMPTPAMTMANADRMNATPQREVIPSPQLDKLENPYKTKHKSR